MGAQEVTGKIFNSRTLPKPVIPDSLSSGNHLTSSSTASPFNRHSHSHSHSHPHSHSHSHPHSHSHSHQHSHVHTHSHLLSSSPPSANYPPNSIPSNNRQDGSYELPKVKREPSPELNTLNRSSQLSLAPLLRPNGNSPTLLGLASVCSSRPPLPSVDSDIRSNTTINTTTTTNNNNNNNNNTATSTGRSIIKSRFSPAPSPYPKRKSSTSSGETMDHHQITTAYSSPRPVNRDTFDRRTSGGHGIYSLVTSPPLRDRSGSNASTSGISVNSNVRPMMVDSPSPGIGHNSIVPSSTSTSSPRPPPPPPPPGPTNVNSVSSVTDRLWANYRPRGGSFPSLPPRDGPPPPLPSSSLSSHSVLPNLGVPSSYGSPHTHKRPSPSNAGESEKDEMDEESEGHGSATNGSLQRMNSLNGMQGKEEDSFTSHREKRRVIEKKSRMRRVDALDHLRLVVSREYQYQHQQRTHGGGGGGGGGGSHSLSSLHNIDPLTQAPRKNCQADICFEAVEIIEKLRADNDRLRHQNRDLIDRLTHATTGPVHSHSHSHSSHSHSHSHAHAHATSHHHVSSHQSSSSTSSHPHGHATHGGPHSSSSTGGGRTA